MNPDEDVNANVPHWKLRRLGLRAVRVLRHHKDKSPPLVTFEATLPSAVAEFARLYDTSRAARTEQGRNLGDGLEAVGDLIALVRSWLGPLARDLPNLDTASITERLRVPDDVIAAATRLVEIVEQRQQTSAAPLAYAEQLVTSLNEAIERASVDWSDAQTMLAGGQDLLQKTRQAAAALQKELVAFRRSLRGAIGSSHRDFQKLRATRVKMTDAEDDDAVIEGGIPAPVAEEVATA